MSVPLSATEILNQEFLVVRAKLLEVAAALDRLDRAGGLPADDPRLEKIRHGIDVLLESEPGRAERFQLAFSRTYEPNWREE